MSNLYYGGWGAPPPVTPYPSTPYPPQYSPYRPFSPRGFLYRDDYAQLRRHSNCVGLCFIAYFVLQYYLFYGLCQVMALLNMSGAYLSDVGFSNAMNAIIFSFLSLFSPFFVLSLRKGAPSYIRVLPFSPSKKKLTALMVIVAGFGICIVSNIAANLVSHLIRAVGVEEVDVGSDISVGALEMALNLICTAAIPALVEEFVFRGVLMQPLRCCGEHFAVLSTAFLFGVAHGSVTGFVFAFLVGLALGYAAVITGSLWPGIIIHFLNNSYAAVVTDLSGTNPQLANMIAAILSYGGLVLGAGALIYLIVSRSFRFEKGRSQELISGRRFKGFFLSAPLLVSIGIFVYFIVRSLRYIS